MSSVFPCFFYVSSFRMLFRLIFYIQQYKVEEYEASPKIIDIGPKFDIVQCGTEKSIPKMDNFGKTLQPAR